MESAQGIDKDVSVYKSDFKRRTNFSCYNLKNSLMVTEMPTYAKRKSILPSIER